MFEGSFSFFALVSSVERDVEVFVSAFCRGVVVFSLSAVW